MPGNAIKGNGNFQISERLEVLNLGNTVAKSSWITTNYYGLNICQNSIANFQEKTFNVQGYFIQLMKNKTGNVDNF